MNYCQNMVNIQTPFLAANQALLATGATPVPAVGENLLTFMANRLNMSFTNLGCQNFGLTNPVTVVLDGAGAAMSATFNTTPQTASNTTGQGGNMTGTGGTALARVAVARWHRWRRNADGQPAAGAAAAGTDRVAQGPFAPPADGPVRYVRP